jgi:DNA-binding response OmpR family regulator
MGQVAVFVLVVEDDARVARLVGQAISEAGWRVDLAYDGADGLARAATGAYDVIVLDLMLPEIDGIEVCRTLRAQRVRTPVLMLTARDAVPDRVRGLNAGADDYMTKPFALEELVARLRALGRRGTPLAEDLVLRVGELTLDLSAREARRGDQQVELTTKEFDLLEYLMRHSGQVLTKSLISDHVWGYDSEATSNVVGIYIHYLRNKIDRGYARPLIRTVRGIGYTIKE